MRALRATYSRLIAVILVATFILSAPGWQLRADAVGSGGVTLTLSTTDVLQPATYTIGSFRSAKDELVVGYTLTFPSDTDVSAATAGPGDTVTHVGTTVTVMFDAANQIQPRTNGFTITLGNVRNPSSPGVYKIVDVTFHTELAGTPTDSLVSLGGKGTYTITPAPFLSMTITTPDDGQSVDFGAVDPGVPTGPETVTLLVTSSAPYTITRNITDPDGAIAKLDLAVTWLPVGTLGTLQPAAPTTPAEFTDAFTIAPPWTTDPEQPLTASVTYTVVQ